MGSTVSRTFVQENGLPQGSVLSVILFLVSINDLKHHLLEGVDLLLFADDLSIHSSSKRMMDIENQLQLALDAIVNWENITGFKISSEKSKVLHFCCLRPRKDPHPEPILLIRGEKLEQVHQHKVVGLVYDKQLNWRTEISNRKAAAQGNLNLLRSFGRLNGVEQDMLLRLHQTKVLSVVEFGSMAYDSANKGDLNKLNTVHNAGLRIALGAFKTTPIVDLIS